MTRVLGWLITACTVAIGVGCALILALGVVLIVVGFVIDLGLFAAGIVPLPVTCAIVAVGILMVLAVALGGADR